MSGRVIGTGCDFRSLLAAAITVQSCILGWMLTVLSVEKLLFPLIKLDNAIHELFLDQCSPYFNGNQWKISRLPQEEIKVQIQSQKNNPWRFVKSKAHWWPTAFPGLNALCLPWKCWGPDGTISCYLEMSYQILLLVPSQRSQRFEISYQILAPVHHRPVGLQ